MLLNNKADKEILTLIEGEYERIRVYPGECKYNFKCHMNAVHYALKNKNKFITMCIYIRNGSIGPRIHFLNHCSKENKYIDNTIGEWCADFKYYIVKNIYEDDFMNVENIFLQYRKCLRNKLSWLVKILSNVQF